MKNKFILFSIVFIIVGNTIFSQTAINTICPVIPTPSVYQTTNGNFKILEHELFIDLRNLPKEIGAYLQSYLSKAFSINASLNENQGSIIFNTNRDVPGHSYSIEKNSIRIMRSVY